MALNTHGALIAGDRFVAFIDGIPDKCKHDNYGPELWFNNAGEYFRVLSIVPYECDPYGYRQFHEEHSICGGCTSCSKCGKPYTPDLFAIYQLRFTSKVPFKLIHNND